MYNDEETENSPLKYSEAASGVSVLFLATRCCWTTTLSRCPAHVFPHLPKLRPVVTQSEMDVLTQVCVSSRLDYWRLQLVQNAAAEAC